MTNIDMEREHFNPNRQVFTTPQADSTSRWDTSYLVWSALKAVYPCFYSVQHQTIVFLSISLDWNTEICLFQTGYLFN